MLYHELQLAACQVENCRSRSGNEKMKESSQNRSRQSSLKGRHAKQSPCDCLQEIDRTLPLETSFNKCDRYIKSPCQQAGPRDVTLSARPGTQSPYQTDDKNLGSGLLFEMNDKKAPGAEQSAKMDFSRPDAVNAGELNAILWRDAFVPRLDKPTRRRVARGSAAVEPLRGCQKRDPPALVHGWLDRRTGIVLSVLEEAKSRADWERLLR